MGKIDELIKEQCPNGVRFRTLSELCMPNLKSKVGAKKASVMDTGEFPFFTSGKNVYYVNDYMIDGENIFVNDGGVADIRYYDGKASYADHVLSLKNLDESRTNLKFIYYYLDAKKDYINDFLFRGSGLKNLQRKEFMNFKIPVPPLEVQQEIVRMLDSFTELEAELEAELTKRKQQYDYYNELILNNQDWQLKKLRDIADVIDSLHSTPKYVSEGYPMIRVADVKFGTVDISNTLKVSEDVFKKFTAKYKPVSGDIVISRVGTFGNVCIVDDNEVCLGQNTSIIHPTSINAKYLYYYLASSSVQNWIKGNVKGAGYKSLSLASINEIPISLPDNETQNKIVAILDSFDELNNGLSSGLPAEIEARHKQYEYYRDKLLTFEERVAK